MEDLEFSCASLNHGKISLDWSFFITSLKAIMKSSKVMSDWSLNLISAVSKFTSWAFDLTLNFHSISSLIEVTLYGNSLDTQSFVFEFIVFSPFLALRILILHYDYDGLNLHLRVMRHWQNHFIPGRFHFRWSLSFDFVKFTAWLPVYSLHSKLLRQ